jgi:acyl-CoA dehydrogenase
VLAAAGARAALRETVGYVQDRKVFGRPLAEFDNTRSVLARVAVDLDLVETFVDAAVRARGAGPVTPARAAAAAIAATDVHARAVDEGLQLHGGYGYMREYPISLAFADARHLLLEASRRVAALDLLAARVGLSPNPGVRAGMTTPQVVRAL